jgi:transposase InsO family protein
VFLDFREAGETRSKHRVTRLMSVNKIRAVRGYRTRHHAAAKPSELFPNVLQRNFDVARPNKAWVTDIRYVRSRNNHLEPSMSRRGNCWDNAVAESFFSSLKKERIKKKIDRNRESAQADLSAYIDSFYNPTRRHSHLGGVSPEEFEVAGRRRRRVH